MSFKENLAQKVKVDRLAQNVIDSIGPVSGGYKINKDDMRTLLEMAGYEPLTRRHLEMYAQDFTKEKTPIVLLDNELKVYDTTVEDVLVRKEPMLGEMVKFRNIRKILNDQDVVISKRQETVRKIRREILEEIDLTFTPSDIEAFYQEGIAALEAEDADTVSAALSVFAEILGLFPPDAAISDDLAVYGRKKESTDDIQFGPLMIYSRSKNLLHFYNVVLSAADSKNPGAYKSLIHGKAEPEMEGAAVLDDLRGKALAMPEKRLPIN